MKLLVKVVPKAKNQKIILDKSGTIKCYLKSPPEDGKANKELLALLAKKLKTTKRDIVILQGATSRTKLLEIVGFEKEEDVFRVLGLQVQGSLFSGEIK